MSNQYLAQTEKQYQAERVGNKYQTNDQTKNLKHFDRAKKKKRSSKTMACDWPGDTY